MDYDLTRLGSREFEHLTQSLAIKIIGNGVSVFGDGRDGGREATFQGRIKFPDPDPDGPWDGYGVLQAKFRMRPLGTAQDTAWFLTEIRKELARWGDPKSARARNGKLPDYLILATNVTLSSVANSGGIDRVQRHIETLVKEFDLPLKGWRIWHFDQICTFLDLHPEIKQSYGAMVTAGDVLAEMRATLKRLSISGDPSKVFPETENISIEFIPGINSELVDKQFSDEMSRYLGLHHGLHRERIDAKLFIFIMWRCFLVQGYGDARLSAHRSYDVFGKNNRWRLATNPTGRDIDQVRVGKLSEGSWLRGIDTPEACMSGVRSHVKSDLDGCDRFLVLRMEPRSHGAFYRLYEIPKSLIVECLDSAEARVFAKKKFGFYGEFKNPRDKMPLFKMFIDLATEKVSVQFNPEHCIEHGAWKVLGPEMP